VNDPANVGLRLRAAREARGESLSEAAEASGVSVASLAVLERGDPGELAGQARLLGLLRVYARFLGIDAESLLVEVTATADRRSKASSVPPQPAPMPLAEHPWRRQRRRRVVAAVIGLVVLLSGAVTTAAVWDGVAGDVEAFRALTGMAATALSPSPAVSDGDSSAGAVEAAAPASDPQPADTSSPETPAPRSPEPRGSAVPEASSTSQQTSGREALPGRSPSETRVQLLDGTGGAVSVDRARQALNEWGYDLVAVEPISEAVGASTVYHTEGWEAEARSLRRRDPRFANVKPDPGFSADADLHVVMGAQWATEASAAES
jgi:cytoskeleton protein RodZ